MKCALGREIVLISLPLLAIGGAAWLFAGGGRALLPAKDDEGPLRIEYSPLEPIEVAPKDAYQGVDWAAKTSVQLRGKMQVPSGWKLEQMMEVWTNDYRIIYREGEQWKRAPALPGNRSEISQGFSSGGPLSYEAVISDDGRWPIVVKVPVPNR